MVSGRGRLRVFVGAAPGVGKTYKMLDEGRRRRDRGSDVVVGFVETHGRAATAALLNGLEVVPRLTRVHRGGEFTEMDLDAVLSRRPAVALVDDIAHTNIPGGRNTKRWQDIVELLDAGIEVITTVNVDHLESLTDVAAKITGVRQQETVPDDVVRAAEQIELVDMAAEALRRRLAHGNIYAPEQIDAASANYFRVGNLTALRELALLWVADRVDEGLQRYRRQHGIAGVWETRERVVVALTGGPESETLIRRAARVAARSAGGDLLAVHVARSKALADASPQGLTAARHLVESLGGSYHSVVGDDVATALLDFARAQHATQLVLGTSRRGRFSRFLGGYGIGDTTIRRSGDIDVHMVTHDLSATNRSRWTWLRHHLKAPDHPRRATLLAALCVPFATAAVLAQLRDQVNLTSQALIFLAGVVAVARLGGLVSAIVASVTASLLLNYYFIEPEHTFTIGQVNNVIAWAVFVLIGLIVASVVDFAGRQTRRAAHASAQAETLSELAVSVLRGENAINALLERLQEAFGMDSVTLVEHPRPHPDTLEDPRAWKIVAATGPRVCAAPDEADIAVPVGSDAMLLLLGRTLPASDQRVLSAFAAQAAVALDRNRLARQAARAEPLAAADRMRTALLAAVSHDLRTPLAAAKASVTSLRDTEIDWTPADHAELLATADESLDRLTRLVENLLDMSRLQAGALTLRLHPVGLDELVPSALDSLTDDSHRVETVDLDTAPDVLADPALLERVIANIVGNAIRYTPQNQPVLIAASTLGNRVELRVIDCGPGIPRADHDRVFTPFQRLGDRDNTTGVGLGLALSRGLIEAMDGTLTPEETPGGGLTMVIALPVAGKNEHA